MTIEYPAYGQLIVSNKLKSLGLMVSPQVELGQYGKARVGPSAHAGEHWKRFSKKGDYLVHDAEVDVTGGVINKHQSQTGFRIKFSNIIGIK